MNQRLNLAPAGVTSRDVWRGRRYLKGSVHYPMTERMADTIAVHGLPFAVRYYTKRLPAADARLLLIGAYCAAAGVLS